MSPPLRRRLYPVLVPSYIDLTQINQCICDIELCDFTHVQTTNNDDGDSVLDQEIRKLIDEGKPLFMVLQKDYFLVYTTTKEHKQGRFKCEYQSRNLLLSIMKYGGQFNRFYNRLINSEDGQYVYRRDGSRIILTNQPTISAAAGEMSDDNGSRKKIKVEEDGGLIVCKELPIVYFVNSINKGQEFNVTLLTANSVVEYYDLKGSNDDNNSRESSDQEGMVLDIDKFAEITKNKKDVVNDFFVVLLEDGIYRYNRTYECFCTRDVNVSYKLSRDQQYNLIKYLRNTDSSSSENDGGNGGSVQDAREKILKLHTQKREFIENLRVANSNNDGGKEEGKEKGIVKTNGVLRDMYGSPVYENPGVIYKLKIADNGEKNYEGEDSHDVVEIFHGSGDDEDDYVSLHLNDDDLEVYIETITENDDDGDKTIFMKSRVGNRYLGITSEYDHNHPELSCNLKLTKDMPPKNLRLQFHMVDGDSHAFVISGKQPGKECSRFACAWWIKYSCGEIEFSAESIEKATKFVLEHDVHSFYRKNL
ncbi:hypothetical protein H4219_003814 [Mycoemilia scoparia]|uniref:Uncharacterized protein n=1 Tax=Mycoemilia scoparia TaxID=417184 RepID=A0A9W7ZXW1_9FUNG|nr:hypothetical protein H4219_003814 [Mycoemilia scoparia]